MSGSNGRSAQSDILTFDANVPYELAVKYATGREVSNGRVLFSTTDEEVFFVDAEEAAQIEGQLHNLGIQPYQRFRLMRRVIGKGRNAESSFVVAPLTNTTSAGSHPAPAGVPALRQTQPPPNTADGSQSNGNGKRASRDILAECFQIAIDTLADQQRYAQQCGLMLRVGQRDVISVALSLYINYQQKGGVL